jgi:hypothetical protein
MPDRQGQGAGLRSTLTIERRKEPSMVSLLDVINERSVAVERRFIDLSLEMDQHVKALSDRMLSDNRRFDELIAANRRAVKDTAKVLQREMRTSMLAAEKAVTKAEVSADKRFEGVNEFRAQLGDQQRNLMPRAEAEIRFNQLSAALDVLRQAQIEERGSKGGMKEGWGWAVAVLGMVLTLLLLLGTALALLAKFGTP